MKFDYRIKVIVKEPKNNFYVKVDSFEGDLNEVISLLLSKYGGSKITIFKRLSLVFEMSGDEMAKLFSKWDKKQLSKTKSIYNSSGENTLTGLK